MYSGSRDSSVDGRDPRIRLTASRVGGRGRSDRGRLGFDGRGRFRRRHDGERARVEGEDLDLGAVGGGEPVGGHEVDDGRVGGGGVPAGQAGGHAGDVHGDRIDRRRDRGHARGRDLGGARGGVGRRGRCARRRSRFGPERLRAGEHGGAVLQCVERGVGAERGVVTDLVEPDPLAARVLHPTGGTDGHRPGDAVHRRATDHRREGDEPQGGHRWLRLALLTVSAGDGNIATVAHLGSPLGPIEGAGLFEQIAGDADGVRLSKRMSELGLASRREADEWIERGW